MWIKIQVFETEDELYAEQPIIQATEKSFVDAEATLANFERHYKTVIKKLYEKGKITYRADDEEEEVF